METRDRLATERQFPDWFSRVFLPSGDERERLMLDKGSSALIEYYRTCCAVLDAAQHAAELVFYLQDSIDKSIPIEEPETADVAAVVRELDRQLSASGMPRYQPFPELATPLAEKFWSAVFSAILVTAVENEWQREHDIANSRWIPYVWDVAIDIEGMKAWSILNITSETLLLIVTADNPESESDRLRVAAEQLMCGIGWLRAHIIDLQAVPETRTILLAEARTATPAVSSASSEPTWQDKAQACLDANRGKRKITIDELASVAGVNKSTISRWPVWQEYKAEVEKTKQPTVPKERQLDDAMLRAIPASTAELSPGELLDELLSEAQDATPKRQREIADHCVTVLRDGDESVCDVLTNRINGSPLLQALIGEIDPLALAGPEIAETR